MKNPLKGTKNSLRFKVVTWNIYHGTSAKKNRPVLRRMLKAGVSVFLMQEAGGSDITEMLEEEGLKTYVYGQYRIAWDPKVWKKRKTWHKVLSDVRWESNGEMVVTECAVALLQHIETGKVVKFLSYHLPPHVQRPEWNKAAPNRWESLKESMRSLILMGKRSRTKFLVFGGDDNVDESGAPSREHWDFMLNTKPLVQHQAPRPTHGGGRRIDDLRVSENLVPVGDGRVWKAPGDHGAFVMELEEAA